MSNHSQNPEMSEEFIRTMGLGKTNQFPRGKIHHTDEGELKLAVGTQDDKVIIHFGTPTAWLGMYKEQAIEFGKSIIEKAESIITIPKYMTREEIKEMDIKVKQAGTGYNCWCGLSFETYDEWNSHSHKQKQ